MASTSTQSAQDPQLADYRNKLNLKSLTRSDPHITAILETSVYSVIYEYDDAAESWEKQKQEGPLFIVRRDNAPEYSLYMLNRQSVKNVAIPLIPGEVKLTTVNSDILQVARRGEKQRRGVWFHGGAEALERFRKAIYEICGEPRRPTSTQDPMSRSPAVSAPNPAASAGNEADGLARLFAPLLQVKSSSISPSLSSSSPRPDRPATSSPHPPNTVPVPPAEPPADPPPPTAPGQPVPQPQSQSVFAPGETVHDLLHSILGVNPFSSAPVVHTPTLDFRSQSQQVPEPQRLASMPPPQSPAPPNPVRAYSNSPAIPPGPYAPYSPSSVSTVPTSLAAPVSPPAKASTPWTKIGDASFAQAAGGGSAGAPSDTDVVTGTDADLDFGLQAQTSNYNGRNGGQINQQRRRSPLKKTGQFNGHFDERAAKADTLVNGMVSRPKQFGKVPMSMINDTAKKLQFKQSLLELIHSDPAFVDELWVGYLTRRAQAGAT